MKKMRNVVKVSCAAVCTLFVAFCASGANRTWNGNANDGGLWGTAGNWAENAVPVAADVAIFNSSGGTITVAVANNHTVQQIQNNGTADVVINIDANMTLTVSNTGSTGIQARGANTTINGPGLLALSTGGDTNPLDCGALLGFTLTYNAQIVAPGGGPNTSVETYVSATYDSGTVVMGYPLNAFTGPNVLVTAGHTLVVPSLANRGQPCSIGAGNTFYFTYLATLRYTGTGDSTDRSFLLNGSGGGQVEHAGTGPLLITGPVYNLNNSAQTFVLRGGSSSEVRITGDIYNNTGTLAVRKEGTGTWVLGGNNTFTGGLTVNGGMLGLDSPTAFGASTSITMADGTALSINPSGKDFSAVLPTIVAPASGSIALSVADALNTSSVTLNGLNGAFNVAISAPGAGTAANRIFIPGLPSGPVGAWLTLNGGVAQYDQANGLSPVTLSSGTLATKGNALPDGPTVQALIDTVGAGPDIWLDYNPTTLFSLTMGVSGGDALVNLAGKTLWASELAIAAGADALTIGASRNDGTFLPPGIPPLAPPPNESAIAALNPLIWYDPSDIATVTTNATGLVTNLANKALSGATYDGVVRSGHTGPTYTTGEASHSPLPMLRNTGANQGLQSRTTSGISTNNPRTLVSVMSRNPDAMVSIGEGQSGKVFENYLLAANTRFGAYNADINMPTAPEGNPIVMVFHNGVNGDLFTYQGFADGIASSTLTTNILNTTDTPLHLGHRNGSGTYVGQIGEVMLFDRILDETERKTVEAYLLAKWKVPGLVSPTAPQQKATLTLRNDSAADLTVNAAISTSYDNVVSLVKLGTGNATLAGSTTLAGSVLIDSGTLAFHIPDATLDTLYGATSGNGKLAKDGLGMLALPLAVANQHTGGTDILGGTVRVGNNRSLGTGPVAIADGGTLDLGGNLTLNALTFTNSITVSGAGVDGKGAIVNNGTVGQMNAFQNTTVTLAGDATFGGTARWDFRTGITLDLGGNAVTKVGNFALCCFGGGGTCSVLNAPDKSIRNAFDIQQGELLFETAVTLSPNDNLRNINIAPATRFGMYNLSTPINWTFTTGNASEIYAASGNEGTNANVVTGEVAINGQLRLTANGNFNKILKGPITGDGGLSVDSGGVRAMSLLMHPNNTFTGPVAVSNAVLGLRYPTTLPNYLSRLSLANNIGSAVRVFMGGTGDWTSSDVEQLAHYPGLYTVSAQHRLQVQVYQDNTATLAHSIGSASAPFPGSFDVFGAGTLFVDADVTLAGHSRLSNGALILTNSTVWNAGLGNIYLQDYALTDGTTALSTLTLSENARYIATDLGYNPGNDNALATVRIPQNAGRAVVELKDNAFVQANLIMGCWDNITTGHGAVYQSGNSEWLNTGGASNDGRIGRYGYGYYELADNAKLTLKGWSHLGGINNATSVGILRQTGGTFIFNGQRTDVPLKDVVGESYNGSLGLSRGGTGILHLEGGTFLHYGNLMIVDNSTGGSGADTSGTGIMTVAGTADATIDRQIDIGNRLSSTAILNLNGGKLTTTYINRRNRNATSAVNINFNGGTLCVTNNAGNTALVALENVAAAHPGLYVYPGGAAIELGAGVSRSVDFPLQHPAGAGVAAIALSNVGAGYIAPPYVNITGGGGSGATAFAHIDRTSGEITRIEITCPGRGYTSNPGVSLVGGGPATAATIGTITIAANAAGGLAKTGDGTLTLNAANTYLGPTRVNGGTLTLAHPQALPPNAEIIIGDGTLDLGGNTVTAASVTINGSGGIVNGKVITSSAVKTGPGTATWDVAIAFAVTPGLWEGYIPSRPTLAANLDTAYPNPRTAIELTTTAANGFLTASGAINGKMWRDISTWVYTGYIWNNADTNETWTFAEHFDDDVWIKIDDNVVLSNNSSSTYSSANYMLTPGPHLFEIRFAQGAGGVGASGSSHWFNNSLADRERGWGIDFLGRNSTVYANYVLPKDPGDGSLFTINKVDASAIRVQEGTLLLPPSSPDPDLLDGTTIDVSDGATLDLGGKPRNGLTITGDGQVTNGAPGSGIILSPAGDDTPGTMSVDGIGSLDGATYRVTIHDFPPGHYDNIPGLYEGRVSQGAGNISTTLPNPNIGNPGAIEPTVTAANGSGSGDNFTINGKIWPFYSTYIYTGYIWNRAATNETWTFAKSFDDAVWIAIDGKVIMNHGTYNTIGLASATLTPGPHEFEIRFGQGNGGIGAQRQGWWTNAPTAALSMPVGVDFLGRNAENCENYSPLHINSGGIHAPLFTTTAKKAPGQICDVITATGILNLSGLTIVPSDIISETPPGTKYVIATANGFIGTPTVESFTDGRKWHARRNGTELWLTTQGGTVILLR